MTIKRVRLNENVHEKLTYLKKASNCKTLNDVIEILIIIGEEQFLTGAISTKNKKIFLECDNGIISNIILHDKE